MLIRVALVSLVITVLWAAGALAGPDEPMTVDEVRAHPDFVADDYSLSSATNSGDPDADLVYWWIGYIPHGEYRVYYTSFGEPLTCVQWEATGEWVPLWVVDALDKLLKEGLIKLG